MSGIPQPERTNYSLKQSERAGHPLTLPTGGSEPAYTRVIALDPGITTGFAIAEISLIAVTIECGQKKWTHNELCNWILNSVPRWVVCEEFEYRNRAREGLELYPKELIGVVKLVAEANPHISLRMQTAAQGKGHYGDEKLKKMGLYDKSNRHGRDAVRHFLHWYTFGPGYQYNKNQPISLK